MTPASWFLAYVLYAVVQGIFTARVMNRRGNRTEAAFTFMLFAPVVTAGLILAAIVGIVAWATDDL